MTLEQAVLILNANRHRDFDGWRADMLPGGRSFAEGCDYYDNLTEFEAIAIAERYVKTWPAHPEG